MTLRNLFDQFGITRYHARGVYGQHVKILIIDTGLKRPVRGKQTVDFGDEVNVHGLAVSCLISPPENSYGLVGIAPKSQVELADVRDPSSIPIDTVLEALEKGIEDNVDIISISLGTDSSYGPLQKAIDRAAEKGILVFAAAGNSGDRGYEYPAACFRAISVASMNSAKQPSPFNTRNDAVVIFAPGEKLMLPTGPQGEMEEYSGTSFATPFAAGYAALVLSDKRLEADGKLVRMTRREMIDVLRDPHHLSLDCSTHTYVMDSTCTNYQGIVDHERDVYTKKVNSSLATGLAVLLGLVILCIFNLFRKK